MKIAIISGTNRINGNTNKVLDLLTEELSHENNHLDLETIHLGKQHIEICKGCRVCFDRGEDRCPLKDDVQTINTKLKEADLLIFASPVYVSTMSGLLKNWIDRMAYNCHRPAFQGKSAYVIATTGGSPAGSTLRAIQTALLTWGCHLCGSAGFITGARMDQQTIVKQFAGRIKKIAKRITHELEVIDTQRPNLIELITFRIQQQTWKKADPGSLDYKYWEDNGWLEPGCSYYYSGKSNILSRGIAWMVGLLAGFFI